MEKAPPPASATTTKPSTPWQDRAMSASVSSLVAMPPPSSAEALAAATQALGVVFTELIEEATTMSALKTQEHNAKKRAERRLSEYEKAKGHHDKYPSIRDAQTVSKTEAEKELKAIRTKVNEKQSALQKIAIEAAEKLIPTLLARGGGNPAEQQEFQNRLGSLEKKQEEDKKTIKEQAVLLAEQQKVIQTLKEAHQALSLTVKEKHMAFTKTLADTHSQFTGSVKNAQGQATSTYSRLEKLDTTVMTRVDGILRELKNSQQVIDSLKKDVDLTKGDIAKISTDNAPFSSELKKQAHNIQTLFSRVTEIDTIRTELKNIEAKSQTTAKDSQKRLEDSQKRADEEVNKIKKNCTELLNHCVDLATNQKTFRDNANNLTGRVDTLEKRPELAQFDARLRKLEDTHTPLGDTAEMRKDIEVLKSRVKQAERLPEPLHLPAKPGSASLDARVNALEKATQPLNSLDSRVAALEQARNPQQSLHVDMDKRVKSVEIGLSSLRSKELADVKKQIAALEVQPRTATPPVPSLATSNPQPYSGVDFQPYIKQVSARLDTVENRVQGVEDAQETHDQIWTGILEENIKEESQRLQARISSLETSQSQMSSRIDQAGLSNGRIEETASKVAAIFKANPESLPSTAIDETQKANLINDAQAWIINTLKQQPDILPFPTERSTYIINQMLIKSLVPVQTSMEATNLSLGNLQARVDNINTLDLAKHALGQLYELHPDLARVEATIGECKTLVAGIQADIERKTTEIDGLSKSTISLEEAVRNLEVSVQDRQTAEAMTERYQELRKEVDALIDDGITVSGNVKTLTTTLDTLSQEVTSLNQEFTSLDKDHQSNKKIIAVQLAQLHDNIERIDDTKMDKNKEAPPRPSPAVSQRSTTTNGTARGPRPASSSSIGNRQPSVSSNKKRKHEVLSAKPNGARPHAGSPRAKKSKKTAFGDDSEADPDYNEDIPEPGVSSDEE